jgi:ABC-type transport system substrate-binding protein
MAHRMISSIPRPIKTLVVATSLVVVSILFTKANRNLADLTYIITETAGPESFDPINADGTQNLPVMRMLYATPLESGANSILESSILSEFKYDAESRTVRFTVKSGLRYSDGQELSVEDVALAVARMAYFRPTFPVIKNIVGVTEWSARRQGIAELPAGIRIYGDSISIVLDRPQANPLFRFCLELFSVVPKSCIDLTTGKLLCKVPPFSGYFNLTEQSSRELTFEVRKDEGAPKLKRPLSMVRFKYQTLEAACSQSLKMNEVIAGSETEYLASGCVNLIESKQLHWLPSARFLVLRFNPHHSLFDSREARQFFAERVRRALSGKNTGLEVQRSLFPKLLPGYLKASEFSEPGDVVASSFRGKEITLPQGGPNVVSGTMKVVIEVARELGMKVRTIEPSNPADSVAKFVNGEFGVTVGGSGFWAQDPVGDLSMWFTKSLHKTMTFAWEDEGIYSRLANLETEVDPERIRLKMEDFNKYIYAQSIIAPVAHFRRLFITSSQVDELAIPQAITSPAPWHLTAKQ